MATYVCADFHGHYKVYEKIKSLLNPNDIVYFLGDAGDRGPESWKTIKAIYNDPQFIFIKGNHEDMLVKAAKDYLKHNDCQYHYFNLCYCNGGEDAMMDWERDPDRETWVRNLENLPLLEFYINSDEIRFALCHAGFSPWLNQANDGIMIPTEKDLLWNRDHYFTDWKENDMEDLIVIHGHTPTECLAYDIGKEDNDKGRSVWYCEGHKIDIDSGGFFTGRWVLFNLDTLEEQIILDEPSVLF